MEILIHAASRTKKKEREKKKTLAPAFWNSGSLIMKGR
jgi:hypothetical protein